MTVVAIVGSRHWTDYEAFRAVLSEIEEVQSANRIVSGGAHGVDQMAERFADESPNCTFNKHIPDTRTHRTFTQATHARNQQIVDDLAECQDRGHRVALIALPGPDSRGTWDTVNRATRAGIKVIVREVPE